MADGYARSTGKPGVCCVTTGPGVTNAATGLAVAHSDSIPVLLVSSNVHSEAAQKWRGLFHAVDQLAASGIHDERRRSAPKWRFKASRNSRRARLASERMPIVTSCSIR